MNEKKSSKEYIENIYFFKLIFLIKDNSLTFYFLFINSFS